MFGMGIVMIVGIIAVLVVIGTAVWLIYQGRQFRLNNKSVDEKPEWMRTPPPEATIQALKADGQKMAVFDYDPGEKVAAPFAEQIEDMVHAVLNADPFLKSIRVDFGTAPDGSLVFDINGTNYPSLDAIPEGRVKVIIQQAIESFDQSK